LGPHSLGVAVSLSLSLSLSLFAFCIDIYWNGKILSKSTFELALYELISYFHRGNSCFAPSDFGLVFDFVILLLIQVLKFSFCFNVVIFLPQ
jgi:hypothetical protein